MKYLHKKLWRENLVLTTADNKHFFTESEDCEKTPPPWCEVNKLFKCKQPVTQSYTEANLNQNTVKSLQTPDR